MIDKLKIIDGYIDYVEDEARFIMRGINGYAVTGVYKADGLRDLARVIHDNEPFSFIIDKKRTIFVPVESNVQIKKELFLIADELEGLI